MEICVRYESNPKHKEPWQRGRKGALCPKNIDQATARRLLSGSELVDGKRYAVDDGRAYCAQEHRTDVWHGYPVGWAEVPESLRREWRKVGRMKRKDVRDHWDE